MAGLVSTNVYLEDTQKKALAKKAKTDGTNISAEMRRHPSPPMITMAPRMARAVCCSRRSRGWNTKSQLMVPMERVVTLR